MAGLYRVAEHLSARARALVGEDADAFGRSALNRYYYATYLTVRDLLAQIDGAWEKEAHKNIPALLEGAVLKRIKNTARQLWKRGALEESRERTLIAQANAASSAIASVLRSAYAVRVAADYEPSHKVVFDSAGFRLVEHTDAEARNWTTRVERQKGILMSVSKELGIV